ncbi:hypothetical protein pVa21_082 [Vibrio phage pVa-21]|nr:hypothetical protein pVa21_082 [Vibrio phage pVa-21]
MNINTLKASTTIQHLRKGDKYTVLAVGKMEERGGNWVPSVTFRKINTDEVYTRAASRVAIKFKVVEG